MHKKLMLWINKHFNNKQYLQYKEKVKWLNKLIIINYNESIIKLIR